MAESAGFIRNQQTVARDADLCFGFPLGRSHGARHCMDAAERAGITVVEWSCR